MRSRWPWQFGTMYIIDYLRGRYGEIAQDGKRHPVSDQEAELSWMRIENALLRMERFFTIKRR